MGLSALTVKYSKFILKSIKREKSDQIVANCPACGDTKGRLSIASVSDEVGVCRCFNGGCIVENGLPFPAFLKMIDENLYNQYRREKFNIDVGIVKEPNLNHLLKKVKKEPVQGNIKLPEIFGNLKKLNDVSDGIKYVENRGITEDIYKNWYYSSDKFIKVLDKTYFVEDSIFIPIIQHNKLAGFYTRSIKEKRFSTIIFPNKSKYWSSMPDCTGDDFWVFEGIFDALSSGHDKVIAMLSADLPDELLDDLINPIFVFDNDKTGRDKALKMVKQGYSVFVWTDEWEDFKDMNEVFCSQCSGTDKTYISNIIKNNIFNGIQAEIKLSLKKL